VVVEVVERKVLGKPACLLELENTMCYSRGHGEALFVAVQNLKLTAVKFGGEVKN